MAILVCLPFILPPAARADLAFAPAGSAAGQTSTPRGLAVNQASGDLYVADRGNKRVDVFAENGDFVRAFGWGVDTGAAAPETCTTESTCQAGLFGSGAGQFGSNATSNRGPDAIAVDNDSASPSYQDVYVYDRGNARLERFTAAGAFVLTFGDGVNQTTGGDVCTAASGNTCGAGIEGTAPGQLVSNSLIGVGLGGVIYVFGGPNRLQKFDAAGNFAAEIALPPPGLGENTAGFDTDSAGNFYTANGGLTGAVRKYDAAGNCLNCPVQEGTPAPFNFEGNSLNIRGLAIDYPSGRTFVADRGGTTGAVNLYDSAGAMQAVIYGDEVRRMTFLAARHTASGDFYAVHEDGANTKIVHVPIPGSGPVVLPGIEASSLRNVAVPIGNTNATLHTKINPEGAASTHHFEYVDDAAYQSGGFSNPGVQSTPELPVGSDFNLYSLSAEIGCVEPQDPPQSSCLVPETIYHFRAVATDGTNPANIGPENTFTTRPPFEFGDIYSTGVGISSATVHAELNPLGIPASGRFEYVDDATYQLDKGSGDGFQHATRLPAAGDPPIDFGDAADQLESRSVLLDSLEPDTLYHYRLVAADPFTEGPGPETTFHTFATPDLSAECPINHGFRTGTPSAGLPDCRAYEMVSPLDKQGASIRVQGSIEIGIPASLNQARPGGDALTYSSYRAFGEDAEAASWSSQYLSSRDPASGWQIDNISPPQEGIPFYDQYDKDIHFEAFGEDLCSAFFLQVTDRALVPGDQPGYPDLYRILNCSPSSDELITVGSPQNIEPNILNAYWPKVQGFSIDGSRAVFRANAELPVAGVTPQAADIYQVYVKDGPTLRLVSVLPDGTAATLNSSAGVAATVLPLKDSIDGAVSDDASRVYWTTTNATPTEGGKNANGGAGRLYVRINPEQAQSPIAAGECTDPALACTIPVSETVSAEDAVFRKASPSGSRALFTIGGALYSFDLASETSSQIATGVQGPLGASDDLTRAYFVSTDVLAAGAAAGEPNLYFHEQGAGNVLVATITDSKFGDTTSYRDFPVYRAARVSPDGTHAAFISDASPTGYDNAEAASGVPVGEVYLYDAAAGGGGGELLCISCNPSGARPVGRDFGNSGVDAPAAARIPGWVNSLYSSRVLSADGKRVFFESYDALLPQDVNGVGNCPLSGNLGGLRLFGCQDVYEWEVLGAGDCDEANANYFESNGGCLSLISTGDQNSDASSFVDASTDGSDVFLLSAQRLHGADSDSLGDIYDARVDGGFPAPPPAPSPCDLDAGACENDDTTVAPDIPGAGTPGFQGPADPSPVFTEKCPKGKRKVHRHGKVRCVKRHRRGHLNKRTGNKKQTGRRTVR